MLDVNDPTPPTEATGGWLYAACDAWWYPEDTPRSGKWLVFLPDERIDTFWFRVRFSLSMWRLGRTAKVTTGRKGEKEHVVCVYTYDYADVADVMRIRQELRNLSITYRIPYKSNEQTHQGLYGAEYRGPNRSGSFTPIYRV